MRDALYRFDGARYHPGPLTVGPWSPDAQHGGPVAALLARALEGGPESQLVRLTIELLRPVPMSPLTVSTSPVKAGRSVAVVDATVEAGGREVARARGLRVRREAMDLPVERSDPPGPLPTGPPTDRDGPTRTAFAEAVDLRFIEGSWDQPGPAVLWSRLAVPVVDGDQPTPVQRAAAAADFGNGISRLLDFATHTFINPDLTVSLARVPEGEWIGFEMVSRLSTEGFGQAESRIFDPVGTVGRSSQSLIITRR